MADAASGSFQGDISLASIRSGRNVAGESCRKDDDVSGNFTSGWQWLLAQPGFVPAGNLEPSGEGAADSKEIQSSIHVPGESSGKLLSDTPDLRADLARMRMEVEPGSCDLEGEASQVQISEDPRDKKSPVGVTKPSTRNGLDPLHAPASHKSGANCSGAALTPHETAAQQINADPVLLDRSIVLVQPLPASPACQPGNAHPISDQTRPSAAASADGRTGPNADLLRQNPLCQDLLNQNPPHEDPLKPDPLQSGGAPVEDWAATRLLQHGDITATKPGHDFADTVSPHRQDVLAAADPQPPDGGNGKPSRLHDALKASDTGPDELSFVSRSPSLSETQNSHARERVRKEVHEAGLNAFNSTALNGSAMGTSERVIAAAYQDGQRDAMRTVEPEARERIGELRADGPVEELAQRWTHPGPRIAEAGFEDPQLGWVSVRAERDAAGLHAALVPSSHDAERTLSAHLSGLNAHLEDHNIAVTPVTVTAVGESHLGARPDGESQRGTSNSRGDEGSQQHRRSETERVETSAPSGPTALRGSSTRWETGSVRFVSPGLYSRHISLVA